MPNNKAKSITISKHQNLFMHMNLIIIGNTLQNRNGLYNSKETKSDLSHIFYPNQNTKIKLDQTIQENTLKCKVSSSNKDFYARKIIHHANQFNAPNHIAFLAKYIQFLISVQQCRKIINLTYKLQFIPFFPKTNRP